MLLDEQYLKEIGVADLPEDVKKKIVDQLEDTLQDSISVRVLAGLPDNLVDEYSNLSDGSLDDVKAWLARVMPYYATSPEFLTGKEKNVPDNEEDFVRGYALIKWLTMNVPNYSEIVADVLGDSKRDIVALKEQVAQENP